MVMRLIRSRNMIDMDYSWSEIVSAVLTTTKTLVSCKKDSYARISYFKNFPEYTLEVNVIIYENNIYVHGVNKNVQLKQAKLSAMLK
ncbi:MAG: hypothetical protein ABIG89_03975 [Candidatus Woesearchaeota archaeon]